MRWVTINMTALQARWVAGCVLCYHRKHAHNLTAELSRLCQHGGKYHVIQSDYAESSGQDAGTTCQENRATRQPGETRPKSRAEITERLLFR